MLNLIRRHRWWFLTVTLAAVLLRLFFVVSEPVVAGDTQVYGDIARCLLENHFYGQNGSAGWAPTLIRLPGYPFFIAFSFLLFGKGNYTAVMLLQLLFDLGTCLFVADIARRVFSERAARAAFLLTASCPFLICYVAVPLTECLENFFLAAATDAALLALGSLRLRHWALCGAACAGAILLRPDGGLILVGVGLPLAWVSLRAASRSGGFCRVPGSQVRQRAERRRLTAATLLLFAVALAPLLPWTVRNWRTFHVFQPLVTTHASDPGEWLPLGWERWITTWLIDYASVEDVAFHVPGEAINMADIPERAYSSDDQRPQVRALIEQYNRTLDWTPENDRQWAALAEQNVRRRPVRYYLLLPAARTLDMWFRPRIEMFPLDTHFWRFREDPHDSACALALAALNLLYVATAVVAAWKLRRRIRHLPLLLTYPIVRTLFLATTGAAEDRYTLECYPYVLVLGAVLIAWLEERRGAAHREPERR